MKIRFFVKQLGKMSVQNVFLPVVYLFCCRKKVNKKLVVFADAHHEELPFSMRCLYEELQKTDLQTEILVSDYGKDSFFVNLKNMIRFMERYACAGCVVLCDNFLPAASCRKRKETRVIQLWHGCGALKKFGYDTTEDIPSYYHGNVLKNCDLITVSAPWCIPHFSGAMGLPAERFVPLGVSRTDYYYQPGFLAEKRERFRRCYPEAQGKKVILWAPTFRGNAAEASVCGEEDIDRLGSELGDGWYVIKSIHPHLMRRRGQKSPMTAEELLVVTDLLITDYSSILFDYLIFDRPLVLFSPDLEEYEKKRGFYMDYRELPGRIVTEGRELCGAVLSEWETKGSLKRKESFEKYMKACDGKATGRIAAWIKGADSKND